MEANETERKRALHDISRKFTLAEAALRDIAQYPLPARGESLARIAREALEAIRKVADGDA